MNYEEAYKELQEIVKQIETGNVNVDELSVKVKRAGELIAICREKLFKTEKEVAETLKTLGERPE